jgi:D-sedoheptulose 7-phosphate isomerase
LNLVNALKYSKEVEAKVLGVVGSYGDFTNQIRSGLVFFVPEVNADTMKPHTEAFQAEIWHCFVSHLNLQIKDTKW